MGGNFTKIKIKGSLKDITNNEIVEFSTIAIKDKNKYKYIIDNEKYIKSGLYKDFESKDILNVLNIMKREMQNQKINYLKRMELLTQDILLLFERLIQNDNTYNLSIPLENVAHYIDQNFTTNIDINALANLSGYSYHRFRHIFKEHFSLSPKQYILNRQLEHATDLLKHSKKSIEEYKAWKQSLIFEAVTGKNLNCKKKDSGIEWIGEIPENYKLIRLKFLLKEKLQYGANSSGIEFNSDLPRYIRITDIKDSKTLYDENKLSLSEVDAKDYILDDNDILFARSGATSGKCFIYKKEIGKATFAGYLIRAKIDETKLLPNFLVLYTMTKAYEEWKNQVCIQATIQNISAEKYVNLIVPVPPLPEQESIAKMLDSKCAQIDSLIAEKELLIQDLAEYKKSLIFEVVTGKRSV